MKQILRWLILGGTLFFLAKALKDNWLEVSAIRIDSVGWATIAIATGVTLLAHVWAGWVWTWVLQELKQPVDSAKFIQVYLKTNLAKYLPGNVWHYYGRIMAAKKNNVSDSAATLSVLLEPLLMAAAALIIVLLNSQFLAVNTSFFVQIAQFLGLLGVLCAIHPRFLNSIIRMWHKIKTKRAASNTLSASTAVERYPWRPLLGELGFLGLRGSGFVVVVFALSPLNASQVPLLLGAFSFAWLLGLVIPGAPGGLGVFEATAIAMLQHHFPVALVFSATVLYRLVSILAETAGATLAWLEERQNNS